MSNSTSPGEADFNLYGYDLSKTTAYTYVALFASAGLLHFMFIFPLRAAFFIPLVLGCAMEAGGYYCRAWSTSNTHKILPFVLQGLLILAAPPLLAATIYMMFGRIIRNLKGEASSLISPKWLTTIFVMGDRGSHVVLGGLIFQVSIFCLFAILTSNFHVRFHRTEASIGELPWARHMVVLYLLSLVFIVRNLVRIAEFLQGDDGYITTHESMLYIFDGTFMLFVVALLLVIHPGRLFKAARRAEKIKTLGAF